MGPDDYKTTPKEIKMEDYIRTWFGLSGDLNVNNSSDYISTNLIVTVYGYAISFDFYIPKSNPWSNWDDWGFHYNRSEDHVMFRFLGFSVTFYR